jgi:TonB family protein
MPNKDRSPFITTGEKLKSFIIPAFVISLVVHFVLIPIFPRMTQHNEEQTVEKVSVTKKIVVKVPTPPPPTPTPPPPKTTPPPKQQPKTQPKVRLKIQPPKTTSNNASTSETTTKYVPPVTGSENGNPSGTVASAAPAPPAPTEPPGTPKPACKTPYQDATATNPVTPDYPDSAREMGLGEVQVTVEVTIGPSGNLQDAKIAQSGNNMAIDQAALSAARQSTYAPKIVNCQPVVGTYLFKVTFDPNQ